MTTMKTRLPSKAATVEKALRMSVQGVRKVSKYRNQPTMIDGIRFASKAEGRRYQELKLLEKAREIYGLRLQNRYELRVLDQKVCTYVADFVYFDKKAVLHIEDVKGAVTPEFKLKARLFHILLGQEIEIIKAR